MRTWKTTDIITIAYRSTDTASSNAPAIDLLQPSNEQQEIAEICIAMKTKLALFPLLVFAATPFWRQEGAARLRACASERANRSGRETSS